MTMRYAATLASTAEREFLAMVKIGRDGRQAGMDRRDMLDILQLDRRTDRILPNGYCLLPPVRSCDKGNACHGCDHFARLEITALEEALGDDTAVVRGPGVCGRAGYQDTSPVNIAITQKPEAP